jgi:hypothetical protein
LRYDVLLEMQWLREVLDFTVDQRQLASYRRIDVPENTPEFYILGQKAAAIQLRHEHLASQP